MNTPARLGSKAATGPERQQGIVLVVGLVFLLVLTILGVTALRTTTLEERMAGNLMSKTFAFQDAEGAIAGFLMKLDPAAENAVTLSNVNSCSADETRSDLSNNDSELITNTTCPRFLGSTPVPRMTDQAYGSDTGYSHFSIESHSVTRSNAAVQIRQGLAHIGPSDTTESDPPSP